MYKEWEVENEKKDYGKIRSNSNVRNLSNYLVLRKLKDAYPDSDSLSTQFQVHIPDESKQPFQFNSEIKY